MYLKQLAAWRNCESERRWQSCVYPWCGTKLRHRKPEEHRRCRMSRNPAYDKVMKARREADAHIHAARRLDESMKAQKGTAGLANGADATRARFGAIRELSRPAIASQGIDKNLSHQACVLGTISD